MDNAVSVLSGLTGSTEANRTRNNVNAANDKEVQAINNQRAQQLSSIYTQISKDAEDEALKATRGCHQECPGHPHPPFRCTSQGGRPSEGNGLGRLG